MAKKSTDITKTGGMNFRQLQNENAAVFNTHPEYQQLFGQANKSVGYRPTTVDFSTQQGLGTSKYDRQGEYNAADLENIEQLRWENQGTFDTIGNGLAKFAGKVGTTVIGTFAGIPVGIGTAISEGRWSGLWDNTVTQSMAEFDDYMEKNFKNYQSNNQQNASWLSAENFTSAKFWMDDVVTNAGFTVGAMISGNITGGAMGAATALVKGAQLGAKSQKAAALISSIVSATGEGSIEAQQAQKEYVQNGTQQIQSEFKDRFTALDAKYQGLIGTTLQQRADGVAVDPYLESYKAERAQLQKQYQLSMEQLQQEGREVGNRVLAGNQVLLTFGNMIQFGKSFGKSFENATRLERATNKAVGSGAIRNTGRNLSDAAESMGRQMAENEGKATAEMIARNKVGVEAVNQRGGRLWAGLKGPITEGSEEMNQQWITSGAESQYENRHKTVDSYWQDRKNPKGGNIDDYLKEFGNAVLDGFGKSYGDFDQWEQFLIGAMMGGAGMYSPTKVFNQDKTKQWYDPRRYGSYEGGVINDIIDYNKEKTAREGNAKKLNELLSTEKFWNHWYKEKQDLATTLAIQSRQDEHLGKGEKKLYKDDEDDYFAHVIGTFARAGKIDDLRAIYNSHRDLSDEEIDQLVKDSTTKQDNSAALQQRAQEAQQRIQNLLEAKVNMQKQQAADIATSGESDIADEDIQSLDTYIQEAQKELEDIRNIPVEEHYVGNYVDSNGTRTKTNDEIRQELNDLSDGVNAKIDDYLAAAERVQQDTRGNLNDEQDDVLTYLAFKNKSSLGRADNIIDRSPLMTDNFIISGLRVSEDKRLTKREEIRDALHLDDNEISENSDGTLSINTGGMKKNRKRSVFTSVLRRDKENLKLFNDRQAKIAAQNDLSSSEHEQAIKDIEDVFALEEDAMEYNAKLLEYMLNPSLIEQEKNEIKTEEDKKANKEAIRQELGGKSINDILNAMNNSELPTNLNMADIDDELKGTYREAQKIFKKYKSLSDAIEDSDMNAAEKTLLHSLLDNKFENAGNIEDIAGITPAEIEAASRDDILDLTGFDSVEELAAAVGMADKIDASSPDSLDGVIDDIKNGALEAMEKALDAEEKKEKKKAEEPKKRTPEEKKKDEKAEEEDDESTGKDGGTKAKSTTNKIVVDLGEKVINKQARKVRAIKTFLPGSKTDFTIKFQYQIDDKWKDAYVEVPNSFFNEIKRGKDGKGHDITLETLSKDGKIKVLAIKTKKIGGNTVTYAEVTSGDLKAKQVYFEKKSGGKWHENLEVYIPSGTSIDEMLGVEAGSLDSVKAKGTPLEVIRTRGNAEDEKAARLEAQENAEKYNKQESDSLDKKTVLKPQSTRFYIHPFQKSGNTYVPYYELEEKMGSTEEEKALYKKKAAIHKAIHEFMLKHDVFERQKQLKPGDEIMFGFSKELNDSLPEGSDPILLMFDKAGNVVGDIASPIDTKIFDNNTSVANLYNFARKQVEGNYDGGIHSIVTGDGNPITTHVANKYIGVPHFGNENKPATEVLTTDSLGGQPKLDFELGVVMGEYSNRDMKTSNGSKVHTPASAKAGQPFILIHTSDPKRPWYPVSMLMDTLNAETLKGTDFYKVLTTQLGNLKKAEKDNKLKDFKDNLRNFLALKEDELFVAKNDDGSITIRVKGNVVSTVTADDLALNVTQLGTKIIEDLTNSPQPITINVSKNLFGKKFTFFDNEGNEITREYKEVIGPLIYTNLESNETVNDFFDVNPIEFSDKGEPSGEGKAKKQKPPKESASTESRTPTKEKPKNTIKAGYYYNEGDTIIVCDKEGNPITVDENTPQEDALNVAYTYVLAQNLDSDGSYDVPFYGGKTLIVDKGNLSWGKAPISKNSDTNRFVDKFQEDQKKVDRDATDSEHYEIDGKYHVRLHARIDSLYGEQVSLSDTQKKAIDNIRKGLIENFNKGATINDFINNADDYLNFLDEVQRLELSTKYAFEEKATPEQFIDDIMGYVRDKATGMRSSRALKVGSAIDDVVRRFFLDPEVGLPEKNITNGILSDNAYRQLKLALVDLYKNYGDKYSFISDKLVVNANIDGVDVAGELDLLAINKETGEVEVWDIKTSARSFINEDGSLSRNFTEHSDKFARSSQEQYTIQLNAYKDMLEKKYGIKVSGLRILPLFVQYSDEGKGSQVTQVTRQDLIQLDVIDNAISKPKKTEPKKEPIKETPKTEPKVSNATWEENTIRKQLLNSLGDTARGKKTLEKIMEELNKFDQETKDKIAKYLSAHPKIAGLSSKTSKQAIEFLKNKANTVGAHKSPTITLKEEGEGSHSSDKEASIRERLKPLFDALDKSNSEKAKKVNRELLVKELVAISNVQLSDYNDNGRVEDAFKKANAMFYWNNRDSYGIREVINAIATADKPSVGVKNNSIITNLPKTTKVGSVTYNSVNTGNSVIYFRGEDFNHKVQGASIEVSEDTLASAIEVGEVQNPTSVGTLRLSTITVKSDGSILLNTSGGTFTGATAINMLFMWDEELYDIIRKSYSPLQKLLNDSQFVRYLKNKGMTIKEFRDMPKKDQDTLMQCFLG